jgi:23S rRNA G2445 N2-methylase RlmL
MKTARASKDLYRELRALSWPKLWLEEVPRFNAAPPRERFERVSVIRAVGVVFEESGPKAQKAEVKQWLLGLLQDPEEKIRRYAMAALPKFGVGLREEAALLEVMKAAASERERRSLGEVLSKVGGAATAEALQSVAGFSAQVVQKVTASVARSQSPSVLRFVRVISGFPGLRIRFRCRKGLERILRQEVDERPQFRVLDMSPGLLVVQAPESFSLSDLYQLRCFDTLGFALGQVRRSSEAESVEALAAVIASTLTLRLIQNLTEGSLRYRLDYIGKGHQRGAIRQVATRAFERCPQILNDAREAPWAIDVHPHALGDSVELRPRLSPDPRHSYRLDAVPAASHPPLAACLARIAGKMPHEYVWDPFCGSGLELIEMARLGGVRRVFGTDLSEDAVAITERNFQAAELGAIQSKFACCDFRDFAGVEGLTPQTLTLVITNPPLGRRVPIPNLRLLIEDLFAVAAKMLQVGGRLVFVNPFKMASPQRSMRLEFQQVVDLGGFDCRLEVYRKISV